MKKLPILLVLPLLALASCSNEGNGNSVPPTYEIHHYGEWTSANETSHKRVCSDCQDEITENHHFDNGFVEKAPTHTEEGSKVFTCLDCGYTKTTILGRLHDHVFNKAVVSNETKIEGQLCGHGDRYYLSCECGEVSTEDIFEVGDILEHTYTGSLVIKGTYTQTGYLGGSTFDYESLSVQAYCSRENQLVDIPSKKIAFEYPNKGTNFDCEDSSIKVYLVDQPSICCDVLVTVSHGTYSWVSNNPNYKGFDTYECPICHIPTKTFKNKIPNVYVDLSTGTTPTIDLTGISYKSISEIKFGDYDLGTNPASPIFTNVINAGFKNYNASEIKITLTDNDDAEHIVKGSGYVIDKINHITNETELKGLCVYGDRTEGLVVGPADNGNSGSVLKGYYLLDNDIDVSTSWTFAPAWAKAFSGVFDGNNHTVSYTPTQCGIFGNVCFGTIRNTTFNDKNYDGLASRSIIGKELYKSTVENCNFVCTGTTNPSLVVESANKGVIAYGKCVDTNFTNCLFDYSGVKVIALLCTAGGCTGNVFTNSKFICVQYMFIATTQTPAAEQCKTVGTGLIVEGTLVHID